MIEVIYKEEKQEAKNGENLFNLPRNIRQVGLTTGNMRIYIEDYVYTFLTRLARNAVGSRKEQGCVAVFTGETKWNNGITYLFIRGALMVEDMEAASDHIDFSEKIWAKIQEDQAKYFPGQEITGWFFSRPQMYMETDELLTRIHLRYFGGEKVLMLMEPTEKEEAFFRYENSFMVKQSGFYIYYEKNPQMQNYMIEKIPELSAPQEEGVHDDAVRAFRQIIQKKHADYSKEDGGRTSVFSYAATACLALAVLTVGVQFYQNYSNGNKTSQEATETASAVIKEETKDARSTVTQIPKLTDVPRVTTKPKISATPRAEKTVKPTPTSVMEKNISPTPEVTKESEIYREESDDRKAERRVRQERTSETGAAAGNSGAAENSTAETAAGTGNSYVIKPGDTLYQISITKYGTMEKVAEICQANGLTEDEIIYPGQIIVLP